MTTCPDIAAWEQFVARHVDDRRAADLEAHRDACPECAALLARLAASARLLLAIRPALADAPSARSPAPNPALDAADLIGQAIGPFTILRVLGEGGMATVFEARQHHPHRTVALKLLSASSVGGLRRFELEGEILARLHHPGIAQIYQTGSVELRARHRAFLAMELIDGRSVTAFAIERGLSTSQRLTLLARVCDAVHYAHQRGVIHRDLKPANILVDARGDPKVLDFGIAKLAGPIDAESPRTLHGIVVGTLAYMSPEQASGQAADVDTRTDIYALGVIAHELLAGSRPYDVGESVTDALRIIREFQPHPLGRGDPRLRGDIESIVAKALDKDRARRYASCAAMADDIRRHLAHLPVAARPLTALYQFSRLARRHRAAVFGLAAILLVLAAGLIGTSYGLLSARRSERLAELRRADAELRRRDADELSGVLMGMLRAANPHELRGRDYTVRQLLDDMARDADRRLAQQPELLATIHATIGNAYRTLGLFDKARPHLDTALQRRRALLGDDHPLIALSRCDLAWLLHDEAAYQTAADQFRAALDMQLRILPDHHPDIASSLLGLSDTLRHLGRRDEARPLAEQALAMRRAALPPTPADIGEALANIGKLNRETGRFPAAAADMEQAIAHFRLAYGDHHPRLVDAMNELGWVLNIQRKRDEAEIILNQSRDMGASLLGNAHPDVGNAHYTLGTVRYARGDNPGAERELRAALDIYVAAHGDNHPSVASAMDTLARVLVRQKRLTEAEALMRRSIAMRLRFLGDSSADYAAGLVGLANLMRDRADFAQAAQVYAEAVAAWDRAVGADHPDTATARARLAGVLLDLGRPVEALPHAEAALPVIRNRLGEDHHESLRTALALGRALTECGRAPEADPILAQTLSLARAKRRPELLKQALTAQAACHRARERPDEAASLEAEAAAIE